MTRLVLLGGGHAHAIVLRSLREFVSKNLDVALVSESPTHTYSGMVPGVIAGHYREEEAQISLADLARNAGAAFLQGRVEQISPGTKQVVLAGGVLIRYDVLSLNLGSTPEGPSAVKPFDAFIARWRTLLETFSKPRVAVIGAGAGGVELAMAMKHALNARGGGQVELFTDRFLFTGRMAHRIRAALARLSIPLHEGKEAGAGFDAVFRATGASAPPLLRESGLKTDAAGFAEVGASLRSLSHADVFAAGDCAAFPGGLPKSGVYAVRQGPVLAENLKRAVRGMPLVDYQPQFSTLALISCGSKRAIACRAGWSAEGRWVWWWKDLLDRRWTGSFR